jgi:hypothetical protein
MGTQTKYLTSCNAFDHHYRYLAAHDTPCRGMD